MVKHAILTLLSAGVLCAANPAHAAKCATFYEHINFGGGSLSVEADTSETYIGNYWNDKASSIHVEPGCSLKAWEHANYEGRSRTFTGFVSWVGNDWNDIISSYQCTCH